MGNALDNLRHLIDCYAWRDSRDMQDFIDAADMIDKQYVELPRDADGIYIRVGDDMEVATGALKGEHSNVEYLAITESGWDVDGDPPRSLRHHKPDTWEQIITDAIRGDGGSYGCLEERLDAMLPALVDRCKKLAGDDR